MPNNLSYLSLKGAPWLLSLRRELRGVNRLPGGPERSYNSGSMFTMRRRCSAVMILLVSLALLLPSLPTWASERPGPKPEDFFIWEFLGGAVGGAVGGQAIVEGLLSSWCKDAEDPTLCQRAGRVALRPIAYPLFVFAGTTTGIVTIGLMNGVEGNWVAAIIGSFAGTLGGLVEAFAVWYAIDWLLEPGRDQELISPETPEFLQRTIPYLIEFLRPYEATLKEAAMVFFPTITSAFWGTVGFNSGAQMRASSP